MMSREDYDPFTTSFLLKQVHTQWGQTGLTGCLLEQDCQRLALPCPASLARFGVCGIFIICSIIIVARFHQMPPAHHNKTDDALGKRAAEATSVRP